MKLHGGSSEDDGRIEHRCSNLPARAKDCNARSAFFAIAIRQTSPNVSRPPPCWALEIEARSSPWPNALQQYGDREMETRRCRSVILRLMTLAVAALGRHRRGNRATDLHAALCRRYRAQHQCAGADGGRAAGIFTREGINLSPFVLWPPAIARPIGPHLVASRDSFDMARMQLSVLMEPEGRFQGHRLRRGLGGGEQSGLFPGGASDIKTFADLKGKTLTEPSPTDPITAHGPQS